MSIFITGINIADDENSQTQSYPASSKGKRPMRPTSTNQPKGSSSRRQEPLTSFVLPQKRKMTSPESKDDCSDAKRLMPPPPPRQLPQTEKLTTEQVVRVLVQMRLL